MFCTDYEGDKEFEGTWAGPLTSSRVGVRGQVLVGDHSLGILLGRGNVQAEGPLFADWLPLQHATPIPMCIPESCCCSRLGHCHPYPLPGLRLGPQ